MVINRAYRGKMNLDAQPYTTPPEDILEAYNISRDSRGDNQDDVAANVNGNLLVPYTLPAGINKTIGKFADKTRNRVYEFVWNSNGNSSILYYDAVTDSKVKVIQSKTDSNGVDILAFSPTYKINHVDIIYRDASEGDLLFWTDGLNFPSKINVLLATTGGYGAYIKRSFIDVAKAQPLIPIAATYENDSAVTVNNFRKRHLKYKYRWIYQDGEKSAWSTHSELPLPVGSSDPNIDADPTINARVALVFQTGEEDVVEIELAAAESIGDGYGLFFSIQILNKSNSVIPDSDLDLFQFFNDQVYNYLDEKESVHPFDFVPLKAISQAMPNGNVLTYGAITEGYDLFYVSAVASATTSLFKSTNANFIFTASQSGNRGFGTGDITVYLTGTIKASDTFEVQTTSYANSITGYTDNLSLLTQLSLDFQADGFTIVSVDAFHMVVSKANESLLRFNSTMGNPSEYGNSFTWDWSSKYGFGLIYFDSKGRTNGVITNLNMVEATPAYSESGGIAMMPVFDFSISSRPPTWAVSYQIVRTKNLTKSSTFYWVTDRTVKDDRFAYISIENITEFKTDNPQASVGYSFAPLDRITFLKNISDGTVLSGKDYEILSAVTNPIIEGITNTGTFLKIALPTTGGSFDFGSGYNNMFINLYAPAKSVGNGLDVYYEFGQQYAIGNAGTANAFHQGQLQSQTANLLTPALFTLIKGDVYYRERAIDVGADIDYIVTAGSGSDSNAGRITMGVAYQSSTYSDPNLVTGSSPLQNIIGFDPATNGDRLILRVISGSYTFRIKGAIIMTFPDDRSGDYYEIFLQRNDYSIIMLVPEFDSSQAGTYSFQVDETFTLTAGQRLFILGWSVLDYDHTRSFTQTSLTISQDVVFNQVCISENFSDYYQSKVNSNGRAWIVETNMKQDFYPAKVRFGQEYIQDTSINGINRFYDENQDTYDRANGTIVKLFMDGRRLYVFQELNIGIVPVLTQIVKDVSGNPLEANSDILLNKIAYPYMGKYGMGNVPESFAYGKGAIYGCDSNKGVVWRLSNDGITPLSVVYDCNSFFMQKLQNFSDTLNNGYAAIGQTYTGDPAVYGEYDEYTNKYVVALEEINRYDSGGTLTFHQDAWTVVYNESARQDQKGFESFMRYKPEMMANLNNLFISYKSGATWTHNNPIRNNFYGIQYDSTIDFCFNGTPIEKKSFVSLTEMANVLWDCPVITTQLETFGTTQQLSELKAGNFKKLEGQFHSSFMRDMNSPGGKINGWTLKGNYMTIQFRNASTSYAYLMGASVKFNDSALTNK